MSSPLVISIPPGHLMSGSLRLTHAWFRMGYDVESPIDTDARHEGGVPTLSEVGHQHLHRWPVNDWARRIARAWR